MAFSNRKRQEVGAGRRSNSDAGRAITLWPHLVQPAQSRSLSLEVRGEAKSSRRSHARRANKEPQAREGCAWGSQ